MRKLLLIVSVILAYQGFGQESSVTVGGTSTASDEIGIKLEYELYSNPSFNARSKATFSSHPEVKVRIGGSDVFDGIDAKYTVLFSKAKLTTISDVQDVLDLSKLFHVYSISAGFESNQGFNTQNALVEVGYMPWYQNIKELNDILKQSKFGLFLQGGYKISSDSVSTGGKEDQSLEEEEDMLVRVKGSFSISPKISVGSNDKVNLVLDGEAHGWFDAINSEFYYRVALGAELEFDKLKLVLIDFEKGSGAPNFNQGEQWSSGIKFIF